MDRGGVDGKVRQCTRVSVKADRNTFDGKCTVLGGTARDMYVVTLSIYI